MSLSKLFLPMAAAGILFLSPLAAQEKGDAAKGKTLFTQCAVCHNTDTDEKKVGPSLKGLFQRKKLVTGKKVSDENVLAQINSGGGGMPSFASLAAEDKENLLAYLHTL